jgi:hypothetical protein
MEALNVQTEHIARVLCSFMSTATSVKIVKAFKQAGVEVIMDESVLRSRICPGRAKCRFVPFSTTLPGVPEYDDDELKYGVLPPPFGNCTSLKVVDQGGGRIVNTEGGLSAVWVEKSILYLHSCQNRLLHRSLSVCSLSDSNKTEDPDERVDLLAISRIYGIPTLFLMHFKTIIDDECLIGCAELSCKP